MSRCQICDSVIVNDRCPVCGMPYRKDEKLYHLNESRDDHYMHASSKARAEMRDNEIPLGDKEVPSLLKEMTDTFESRRKKQIPKPENSQRPNAGTPNKTGQTRTVIVIIYIVVIVLYIILSRMLL